MRNKVVIVVIALLIFGTSFYFYSCQNRDLRGWWRKSPDGKTYLVVVDPNGSNCPPIFIDSEEISSGLNEKIPIAPGEHKINCGRGSDMNQGTGFVIEEGTTFHFDYWGP